jgi:magnesium chelatase subunit I
MDKDPFGTLRAWFGAGNEIDVLTEMSQKEYEAELSKVPGLAKVVDSYNLTTHPHLYMEFLMHGLAEYEVISKDILDRKLTFKDPLANIFNDM